MPRQQDDTISESDHGKIPKSTFEIYRAEGDSQFRNKNYQKAIDCYTQALELKPEDQYCLVHRSKCHLNSGSIDKALTDAEKSLDEDKAFYKGIHQKAEVLYFKGDFENALVYYHRGHKLRPEMQEFRLGIQKTEEAINNSVGDSNIIKLKSDGDLSYFYQAEEKKKPAARSSYQKPKKEDSGPKRAVRKPPNADEKTIKKMLGNLYDDREYLEKLLREESAKARKTEHSDKIQDLCVEGLNYLDSRSEFWQQQKPLYSRKPIASRKTRKASANDSRSTKLVLTSLEDIDDKQAKGDHDNAIKLSNRLLKTIENWSENELPNKFEVQANLYSIIGNSLLELDKYDSALKNHEKDLALGQEHSLKEAQSRALDNIGRVYAKKGDYSKAIEVWERKDTKDMSPLEATWLFHEIGRCYLELNQPDRSKELGEKSLDHARQLKDDNWQLNASVLLAQSEVKLGNYQSAIDNFENARELADSVDNRQAEDAIEKAIEDVNRKIDEEERQRDDEEHIEKDEEKPSLEETKKESEEHNNDTEAEREEVSEPPAEDHNDSKEE